ncbi:MAG TPA: outer membrane protein assembly factor BamE [Steroidobacteraceae bacterium]|nr:outer membrane protein assembly factor BamE [Steroidobacteraceae bacterium]
MRTPRQLSHAVLAATALALIAPLTGGCVYRLTIQQGNFLQKRSIAQLQVGMTRSQVRYLLGTPMVPTTFDTDRWDYLYYLKKGHFHKPIHYLLTVYFQNEKVSRIDSHGQQPIDSAPALTERPPRPMT